MMDKPSDTIERVARALYAQWSEFVFKHLQTELRRFDELGDDLKATWIDRAKAALEASYHAELVEALRECDVALRECGVCNMGFVTALLAKIIGAPPNPPYSGIVDEADFTRGEE